MNIQQAKEEIKNTVRAYLDKDAYGQYSIPKLRQRPILLIGLPGIGKTQIMSRLPGNVRSGWSPIPSPTIPGRAPLVFLLLKKKPSTDRPML